MLRPIERPIAREAGKQASSENVGQSDATFLRLALGFVYFYFGFLKFFPDMSPAELLAGETIVRLLGYRIDAQTAIWWLAVGETALGICFLFNIQARITLPLFLMHMAGTFTPLLLLPEYAFKIAPFSPTMEGQYILKNVVFVAAGWTVMVPGVRAGWRRDLARVSRWWNVMRAGDTAVRPIAVGLLGRAAAMDSSGEVSGALAEIARPVAALAPSRTADSTAAHSPV